MKNLLDSRERAGFYAEHRKLLWVGQGVALLAIGFAIAWGLRGEGTSDSQASGPPVTKVSDGPSMWTCSMHPNIRQPSPGQCPICGMDLIPVTASSGGLRSLTINPEARALMGVALTPVERKYVTHAIRLVGKVDYDETRYGYITAWAPGRLDRLYVDYTGVRVNRGDHMVYIYSPELYSAQEELIQAVKFRGARQSTRLDGEINLVDAAREKLRLLGLTEKQIQEIEKQNKPSDHLTIYSPVGGIVIQKLKQEGDYVKTGERIYTVADLSQMWVHLDAYETDLPWIRYGQDVTITTEAYPGEEFHGRIAFIQPVLNDKTRTVKVRVNVPNPDGKLKPDMFVHAVVKPRVAAGGRVMDASLAGKWISPMHPEIVKDGPGVCDICGMPLVRAETLGYVTPESDRTGPPLVLPASAALVTGKRAVVYVELPAMPSGVDVALKGVSAAAGGGKIEPFHKALAVLSNVLDRPDDQPHTGYARELWNRYADRLAEQALAGQRAETEKAAKPVVAKLDRIASELREQFAPPDHPTFEGREIVLGPRAGDYYLVRHGLAEGELVVTQGNFKIDSEVQIQAKPSMMTPEGAGGGGGGGHDHAEHGEGAKEPADEQADASKTALPAEFYKQLRDLEAAYQQVNEAVKESDVGASNLKAARAAFSSFQEALNRVDMSLLTGKPRMLWKEYAMLLGNDAVEGGDAKQLAEIDRVFLLLKGHIRRMRERLGVSQAEEPEIERVVASPPFQADLAKLWQAYLAMQQALASDDFRQARGAVAGLEAALAGVKDGSLGDDAKKVWTRERANLVKLIAGLQAAKDIDALRTQFKPMSEEVGVLAKTFGFGPAGPVYQLHCPMAFDGLGAIWYQNSDDVRNPYFGSSMLKCADRVEELRGSHRGRGR